MGVALKSYGESSAESRRQEVCGRRGQEHLSLMSERGHREAPNKGLMVVYLNQKSSHYDAAWRDTVSLRPLCCNVTLLHIMVNLQVTTCLGERFGVVGLCI